jgi:5-methylcytosine-specific restriction endonuclease McrA
VSPKERAENIARAAAWNKANKERRKEIKRRSYEKNKAKTLATCKVWYEKNKDRMSEFNRQWKKDNPELVIEYSARRRAVKKNATVEKISAEMLASLLLKQKGCCAYCRKELDESKHLDHKVPLSRGGEHSMRNLAWACQTCNLSKGTKTPEEWDYGSSITVLTGETFTADFGASLLTITVT